MSWNYRIVRERGEGPSGPWESFGLYEVYYDAEGRPEARMEGLASFACDSDEGVEGIVGSLELALADARKRPVLDEEDIGGHGEVRG